MDEVRTFALIISTLLHPSVSCENEENHGTDNPELVVVLVVIF